MSWELIGQGNVAQLYDIGGLENLIDEEQRGIIELDLRISAPAELVAQLNAQFTAQGIPAVAQAHSPLISITFRKGFPWVAVIAGIILGLIALAILIIGWRLYREILATVPDPFKPVLGMGAVVLVGLIAYLGIRYLTPLGKGR